MAFHVYPDPQTVPLNVGANTESPLTGILEFKGPDNDNTEPGVSATGSAGTMFIRLVMLGAPVGAANRPTIFLKANAGPKTEINTDAPVPTSVSDGTNQVADAFRYTLANNIYLFKVFVYVTPINWQMTIKNNDVGAREFTWVVAGIQAESRQPWIDILAPAMPPGLLPGELKFDALTAQAPPPVLTLPVANKGTGILNITSNAGFPLGFSPTLPVTVPPNSVGASTVSLSITFTPPATIGTTGPTNYPFPSDDTTAQTAAGHNRRITLTGTTRKAEVMLMVDASGSMAFMPNGSASVPAPGEARWGRLKEAAKQFLDLLGTFGDGEGRFAVGMFPDITTGAFPAPSPSAADFQPPIDITAANVTAAKGKLDNHTPQQNGGATPMGFGMGRAMGTLPTGFGYFQGPGQPVTLNRRYMVLMTDGNHNSGPPHPFDFDAAYTPKNVRVITVGYGDPGATQFPIDTAFLEHIRAASQGVTLDAGADDAGLDLKKKFRQAIVAGFSLDPTTDPGGVLTSGASEARRQVTITKYDTKVTFVVNWKTPNPARVDFTLLTPTCELITPASPQTDSNISHSGHATYKMYSVNHDYLRNAANPSLPRYGTWTLIISGQHIAGGAREPYDYEVITQSRLNMTLNTGRARHCAGDLITLTAFLALDGQGIPDAAVTLHLDAPGQFSHNWIAANSITKAEYAAAAERVDRTDATAIGIKTFALLSKGLKFDLLKHTSSIPMTDPTNQGIYAATVPGTSTPGTYDLYVTAVGQTAEGVSFRREKRLTVRVEVCPDKHTFFDFRYRRLEGDRLFEAEVRIWPRDRFGNVVLMDPAIDPRIVLTASGGDFTGRLVGNLDGSYTRTVRFGSGGAVAIGLEVDGEPVVSKRPLPAIQDLRYVDKVVDFTPGGEAKPGANKYRDPRAALGDVTARQPDAFVALGARGRLAVAIGSQSITGRGDDDITVFIQPDEDLRSYLVEVLPVGARDKWVPIGTSPGVTQSFGLKAAGLRTARAIRITDTSGRTRLATLDADDGPGVKVMGVGVKVSRGGAALAPDGEGRGCLGPLGKLFGRAKE